MSDLTEMFDRFNRDYFGGRLQRYRVLRRRLKYRLGQCGRRDRLITVRSDLTGDELQVTLLHEMVHAAITRGHGRAFQRGLKRVATKVGPDIAARLARDCANYDGSTIPPNVPTVSLRQEIESDLDSLAMERPGTSWGRVRNVLIQQWELFPATNKRHRSLLAWARGVWRKSSRDWGEVSRSQRRAKRRFARLSAEAR